MSKRSRGYLKEDSDNEVKFGLNSLLAKGSGDSDSESDEGGAKIGRYVPPSALSAYRDGRLWLFSCLAVRALCVWDEPCSCCDALYS